MFAHTPRPVHKPRLNRSFRRAVVIGGSIAGLTAAAVLSKHFETVTVIERAPLADGVDFPKGVPQSRHPHLLLVRGEQILEGLFPGLKQDLLNRGAQSINFGRDLNVRVPAGWVPRYKTAMEAVATSRKLLDHTVYQRVQNIPNVTFKAQYEVMSICADDTHQRAIGVQVRNRVTSIVEDVPAELVVDASGRSSKAPLWFTQLGFAPPQEQTVNAFPGYTTRIYDIPEQFEGEWKALYIMPNPPHVSRGAIILPMEGNKWHVTLIGMNQDYPPTDEEGFLEFARSLVSPTVYEAIKNATPASPIWGYRRAENRLRRFDQLDRYLEGFVALGDAVYALNPVYGQGMTLASISTQLLGKCLTEQAQNHTKDDLSGLAEMFQKQLKEELVIPWQMATNEDMRWSHTTGKQDLDMASQWVGRYFKLVLDTIPYSKVVTDAFFHVQHMISPPTILMRPRILAEIVKTNLSLRFSKS